MPILRNQRYDDFEQSTPRDAFRGMPLQQFPWLLEEKSCTTPAGGLQWNVCVSCLNARPSGFGSKLLMELRATAVLTVESAHRHAFPESDDRRVSMLFGDTRLAIEDQLLRTFEGQLENLNAFSTVLLKEMMNHLNNTWPIERIKGNLRDQLRSASPGGFDSTRWS